jgi:subtilase family serine protease
MSKKIFQRRFRASLEKRALQKRHNRHLFSFYILVTILVCTASQASVVGRRTKTLHGHVPKVVAQLPATGSLPATNHLNLAIGLGLRDENGLDEFIAQLYDPSSPNYQKYLTPEQFTQKFGPTAADYEAVIAFARQSNMRVTARHANRLLLDVEASVADVQRAFQITLRTYHHPTEGREFYSPDAEPTVDAQLPLLDVSGLNNYILPHPKSLRSSSAAGEENAIPRSGSAAGGAYVGKDFRAAYVPGVTLTGTGQIVGLLEFDGLYANDITAFETAAGLPSVPVQTILIDGYNGTPTRGLNSGNPEVSLDIEMAIAMAPGLDKVIVFEAGPNGLENDILNRMASSNQVKQLSCSWGWGGGPSATTDNIFKQMAAQGQSFFDASGDTDAFTAGQVDDTSQGFAPSSCPFITLVGGTTLTTTSSSGAWSSETVWNAGGGEGSSGGISSYYSIPSWQMGISMAANGGSTTQRNIPDVAMVADHIYVYYGNGKSGSFVGTSASAPLWAGLTALINQQAASKGKAAIGFINPAIYSLGKSASYSSAFHDITTGNSTWSSSPNNFYAVPGYDLCTGWGTPAGQSLINALAGPPDSLGISPSTGFTANGPVGGPFGPDSKHFLLTNSGTASLTWSLLNTASWLSVSPAQGSLVPGATEDVIVSLASPADNLGIGAYQADLVFSNWTSHFAQPVSFGLNIGQSLIQNGGFETGDFSSWTLVGKTSSGGTLYNGVESLTDDPSVVHSGSYGLFMGDTQLATLAQNLATVPGQAYLLSFWLDNPTNGNGQRFLVDWIINGTSTNTLYDISNPAVMPWTNLQFIVTAASSNTVLEFAAENAPNAFGLDEISLTPIPMPVLQSVEKTTGGVTITWRVSSGITYQVQYKTDLLQPGWINSGTPVVATSNSVAVTDSAATGSSTQRFYRLIVGL